MWSSGTFIVNFISHFYTNRCIDLNENQTLTSPTKKNRRNDKVNQIYINYSFVHVWILGDYDQSISFIENLSKKYLIISMVVKSMNVLILVFNNCSNLLPFYSNSSLIHNWMDYQILSIDLSILNKDMGVITASVIDYISRRIFQ
jgi:hypothetical protein